MDKVYLCCFRGKNQFSLFAGSPKVSFCPHVCESDIVVASCSFVGYLMWQCISQDVRAFIYENITHCVSCCFLISVLFTNTIERTSYV